MRRSLVILSLVFLPSVLCQKPLQPTVLLVGPDGTTQLLNSGLTSLAQAIASGGTQSPSTSSSSGTSSPSAGLSIGIPRGLLSALTGMSAAASGGFNLFKVGENKNKTKKGPRIIVIPSSPARSGYAHHSQYAPYYGSYGSTAYSPYARKAYYSGYATPYASSHYPSYLSYGSGYGGYGPQVGLANGIYGNHGGWV